MAMVESSMTHRPWDSMNSLVTTIHVEGIRRDLVDHILIAVGL
jgi:hypothetical protein